MSLAVVSRGPKMVSASPTRQAVITVFPRGKEGHSPHPSQQVARKTKTLDITNSETTTSQTRSWLIKAIENTVIEPRCRQLVIGKLDTEKGEPSLNLYGTRDGTNTRCSSRASTHASTNKVELTADVATRPQ